MSGHTRTIVPSSSRWNGDLSGLETDAVAYDGTTIHGTLYGCHKITIASGATVTISNATIEGVHNSNYKWAGLTCEGDATIILEGSNTIKGFYKDYPGIYVPPYKTLTIQGSGSLTATSSGYGAGIGAGYEIDCGNIVIEDGTVTATGGTDAAGIGGAFNAENGKITIGAGITKVVATSGSEGVASIGRGWGGLTAAIKVDESLSDTTSGQTRTIESAEFCTVTFNANGGDGGTARSVKKGYAIGTLPDATYEGHTLDGWFTSASGGTEISSETVVTGNVTYYAHWTEAPEATGFAAWAAANSITGAWNETSGGVYNVFRYVFNVPSGAFANPPIIDIEFDAAGNVVVKTPPVVNSVGFAVSVVESSDVAGATVTATQPLDATGRAVFTKGAAASRFYRLSATLAE